MQRRNYVGRREALQDEIDRLELMIPREENADIRRQLEREQFAHRGERDAIGELLAEGVIENDPEAQLEEGFRQMRRYSLGG